MDGYAGYWRGVAGVEIVVVVRGSREGRVWEYVEVIVVYVVLGLHQLLTTSKGEKRVVGRAYKVDVPVPVAVVKGWKMLLSKVEVMVWVLRRVKVCAGGMYVSQKERASAL